MEWLEDDITAGGKTTRLRYRAPGLDGQIGSAMLLASPDPEERGRAVREIVQRYTENAADLPQTAGAYLAAIGVIMAASEKVGN